MAFRFSFWGSLLALIGIIGGILLGNWQTGRAQYKAQLQARFEAAREFAPIRLNRDGANGADDLAYHRIAAVGRFMPEHTILLDNRLRNGVPGYEVLTPFITTNAGAVLVNRGWISASPDRTVLPQVATPTTQIEIVGLALPLEKRYVELSSDTVSGRVWQNLDMAKYAARSGLNFLPVLVQLHTALPDGLQREWPRPDLRINTNRAYALQWYTLSVAVLILYLVIYVRRKQ